MKEYEQLEPIELGPERNMWIKQRYRKMKDQRVVVVTTCRQLISALQLEGAMEEASTVDQKTIQIEDRVTKIGEDNPQIESISKSVISRHSNLEQEIVQRIAVLNVEENNQEEMDAMRK